MTPLPPAFGAGGAHTRWVERGKEVNILEDARHSSVFYIRKYFVDNTKNENKIASAKLQSLKSNSPLVMQINQ
jgi:hypothetical protein